MTSSHGAAAGAHLEVSHGDLMAELLLESASWVHRRVESLRMDANGGTRLLASLDMTLPEPAIRRGSRVVVPLAVVQKGALRKVDTRDHSGAPMPVLDTADNGGLVVEMLGALGDSILPARVVGSPRFESVLRSLVFCDPASATSQVARFRGWLDANGVNPDHPDHELFSSMVAQFSSHFLFAVEMSADVVGERTVVKYSYEDLLPELERRRHVPTWLERQVGNYAMGASYHFELEAPAGVGFRWLHLYESQPDGSGTVLRCRDAATSPRNPETVLHVACQPGHRLTRASIEAGLSPPLGGLVSVAFWGALLATFCVIFGGAYAFFPEAFLAKSGTISPVASLVLAGPALLLSWLSRAPEHVMVARVLWPVRRLLVQSSLVLFGLALVLAVPLVQPWNGWAWSAVAVLQLATLAQAVQIFVSVGRSE